MESYSATSYFCLSLFCCYLCLFTTYDPCSRCLFLLYIFHWTSAGKIDSDITELFEQPFFFFLHLLFSYSLFSLLILSSFSFFRSSTSYDIGILQEYFSVALFCRPQTTTLSIENPIDNTCNNGFWIKKTLLYMQSLNETQENNNNDKIHETNTWKEKNAISLLSN